MKKKHLNKNSLWHNSIKNTARTVAILSGLVSSIFIILINIMGCSESPYRSNMLTPEDVDRYLFAPDSDTLCLTNGYDTKCVTLVPNGRESRLPVIHIYPKKVVYVFYYEGDAVIRAERHRDDIIDPPIDVIDPPIDIIDPPIDDDKEQGSGGSGVGPRDDVNGGTPGSGNNGNDNNNGNNQGNNDNGNNQGNNNGNNQGNNNGNNQGNNNGNNQGNNNGNNQGNNDNGNNQGNNDNGNNQGNNDNGNTGGTNNGNNQGNNNGNNQGNNNGNNQGNNNGNNQGNNNGNNQGNNNGNTGGTNDGNNQGNNNGNTEGTNNGNNQGNNNGNNQGNNNGNTGGTNNGNTEGTNNGGSNNGNNGNTGNSNNNRNDGNSNNRRDGDTQTRSNNINPSGHNPPDNVLSHLVYGHADDNPEHRVGDGWIVWIFYPHNYVKDDNNDGIEDNPRGLGENPLHPQTGPSPGMYPYGFTFSVSGGEVKSFSQTSGGCTDERIGPPPDDSETTDNRAVGKDNRDDWDDTPCSASGSDYSTQMFVKSSAEKITLTIRWTHGMYAPITQTFNIMKEINMKNYDEEGYDPGHLNQHRWED